VRHYLPGPFEDLIPRLALSSATRWHAPRVQVDPVPSGQLQMRARCDRGPRRVARPDNLRSKSRGSRSLSLSCRHSISKFRFLRAGPIRKKMLKAKTKETLFKFCVQVPRTDREAETFFFPGAIRWKAGGDLEWKQWVLSVDLGTFPKHSPSSPVFKRGKWGAYFMCAITSSLGNDEMCLRRQSVESKHLLRRLRPCCSSGKHSIPPPLLR
jgi:hypothetical protein